MMGYREDWYADRNLPFEKANLNCSPPWQCIGGSALKLPERKLKPASRPYSEPREPGEDTHEEIYGEAAHD